MYFIKPHQRTDPLHTRSRLKVLLAYLPAHLEPGGGHKVPDLKEGRLGDRQEGAKEDQEVEVRSSPHLKLHPPYDGVLAVLPIQTLEEASQVGLPESGILGILLRIGEAYVQGLALPGDLGREVAHLPAGCMGESLDLPPYTSAIANTGPPPTWELQLREGGIFC